MAVQRYDVDDDSGTFVTRYHACPGDARGYGLDLAGSSARI
jgi:hypothetical protein